VRDAPQIGQSFGNVLFAGVAFRLGHAAPLGSTRFTD
jgi:hypothetical protein